MLFQNTLCKMSIILPRPLRIRQRWDSWYMPCYFWDSSCSYCNQWCRKRVLLYISADSVGHVRWQTLQVLKRYQYLLEMNSTLLLFTHLLLCSMYIHISAPVESFTTLTLIARFVGPKWDPARADRTQVGPMLALWTLLSGFTARHVK